MSLLGTDDVLFAREVFGHQLLVVSGFPYTYMGNIKEAGRVDVGGLPLLAAGCPIAQLIGDYSRADTQYTLLHETCNAEGEPIIVRRSLSRSTVLPPGTSISP